MYLVRHAQAGSRANWSGDDTRRPLTAYGRHQAADLVGTFADCELTSIYSSPYLRCVESVAPLCARRSIPPSIVDALEEGPADRAIDLLEANLAEDVMFCSHGDVLPDLLAYLARKHGLSLGEKPKCQKGSIWIIESDPALKCFTSAVYIPPPHRAQ